MSTPDLSSGLSLRKPGNIAAGAPQLSSQDLGAWPGFLSCLESLITAFIFLLQQTSLPILVLFIHS